MNRNESRPNESRSLTREWVSGVLAFVVAAATYRYTNQAQWLAPSEFQPFPFESSIPLLPWSIWIYLSAFIFLPVTYGLNLSARRYSARRLLIGFLGIVLVSGLSFTSLPVRFPRELFPVVDDGSMTHSLFLWVRAVDRSSNCFPSLHASLITYSWAAVWESRSRPMNLTLATWATLIVISTLTTKQHYFVDLLAGIVLGLFAVTLALRAADPSRSASSNPECTASTPGSPEA